MSDSHDSDKFLGSTSTTWTGLSEPESDGRTKMPFTSLFEAMMNGWWIGPHRPINPDPDKACFPDYLMAYQSYHVLMADCSPCATGATEDNLLAEINRVTTERGGLAKRP